jgi:diguanylate cyclase (GGDEF)-like protein
MAYTDDEIRLMDQLKQENEELKQTCKNLQNERESLEMVIAEAGNKQLQAEIACMELEQIFLAVSDAMWAVQEDGTVIRANEAMLNLLDKPTEEVVGRKCHDLLNYGLCQNRSCPLEVCGNPAKKEFDVELCTGQVNCEHYIISVAPLTTIIGTTAIVSQFKNITSRKKVERELEKMNRALSEMARIDGLTGIPNRRYFDELFEKEWKRLAREKHRPFSMILADIDFFKKYNDNYGHQQGDNCLIRVGKALKEIILRPCDMAARYGGEEFALLLPETDIKGAETVGKRARQAILDLRIRHAFSSIASQITMSFGGAMLFPTQDNSPTDLVALADKMLYKAKENGRNKLILAHG